ncbi:hypothetical protein D9757_009287 [Collybiopsis confluens]|uniref:Uncharacterized protein n=1 Tax=Collybiopsis confluens TaxID=2823264 RepID=A0A8H5HAR1_9AGAR|nr:hypothetical protein D9757_009287 [Collybiopsis confluens]
MSIMSEVKTNTISQASITRITPSTFSVSLSSVRHDVTGIPIRTNEFFSITSSGSLLLTTTIPTPIPTKTIEPSSVKMLSTSSTTHSPNAKLVLTYVFVIVGSLVGALVFSAGAFVYIRRWRRRNGKMYRTSTPLLDIEDAANPPNQHLRDIIQPTESETSLPITQPSTPQPQVVQYDLPTNETVLPTDDHDRDVISQMAEMKATIDTLMDHVRRLEVRIESDREQESAQSEGRPPTYVSSSFI